VTHKATGGDLPFVGGSTPPAAAGGSGGSAGGGDTATGDSANSGVPGSHGQAFSDPGAAGALPAGPAGLSPGAIIPGAAQGGPPLNATGNPVGVGGPIGDAGVGTLPGKTVESLGGGDVGGAVGGVGGTVGDVGGKVKQNIDKTLEGKKVKAPKVKDVVDQLPKVKPKPKPKATQPVIDPPATPTPPVTVPDTQLPGAGTSLLPSTDGLVQGTGLDSLSSGLGL
jgi:hypothetical protein